MPSTFMFRHSTRTGTVVEPLADVPYGVSGDAVGLIVCRHMKGAGTLRHVTLDLNDGDGGATVTVPPAVLDRLALADYTTGRQVTVHGAVRHHNGQATITASHITPTN